MRKLIIEVEFLDSEAKDIVVASTRLPDQRLLRHSIVSDKALRYYSPTWRDQWVDAAANTAVRELIRQIPWSVAL